MLRSDTILGETLQYKICYVTAKFVHEIFTNIVAPIRLSDLRHHIFARDYYRMVLFRYREKSFSATLSQIVADGRKLFFIIRLISKINLQ